MKKALTLILSTFLLAFASGQDPFTLDDFGAGKETVATITPESTEVEPGDYFRVAFTLDLQEHWHAYWKNPGSAGYSPSVEWKLPKGFRATELMFPAPKVIETDGAFSYGYEGKVTFIAEIYLEDNLAEGDLATIAGLFEWQECYKTCLPGSEEFSFDVKVSDATNSVEKVEDFFSEAREKLPIDSSAWSFEATEKENVITLLVKYPAALEISEPVYFFSEDQQIDSQAPQKAKLGIEMIGETEVGTITLSLPRNEGNEKMSIDAGEVKDSLSGLLVFKSDLGQQSATVQTPFVSDAKIAGSVRKADVGFISATDADRKAGADVYDVSVKPEVVTLGGAKEKKLTFVYGLALLFTGGLLLNLMPCVFPVLGLKVMGFVAQAGEDESKIKKHGMVFGLGLLVAMWILSAIVISLGLKWGEQLANPVFLVTMIMFFYLMGLNLFGVFEVGTSLTSVGGELQSKKGYSGSFFSGVLTTLVATPCSGPFLGIAMAFALALPPAQAFVAFTVFGLGIASPYILLSFFPALIKKLPRPGAWMVSFKQIMAFFLLATAVFFMKAYLKLVGDDHFNYFLFALVMIGMGVYFYGRWGVPTMTKMKKYITGYGLAGVLAFGGVTWAYSTAKEPEPGLAWNEWYPGIVELSRPKKRIIWVDYTADW